MWYFLKLSRWLFSFSWDSKPWLYYKTINCDRSCNGIWNKLNLIELAAGWPLWAFYLPNMLLLRRWSGPKMATFLATFYQINILTFSPIEAASKMVYRRYFWTSKVVWCFGLSNWALMQFFGFATVLANFSIKRRVF